MGLISFRSFSWNDGKESQKCSFWPSLTLDDLFSAYWKFPWRKKEDANIVSILTSKGAFVPDVYYNVQVAQSVTISNEDKKYDFYVASRGGGVQDFL